MKHTWFVVFSLLSLCVFAACDNCDDTKTDAEKFFSDPANLACSSDDDCVVVDTGCFTFNNGACGQSPLGVKASQSSSWSSLKAELKSCQSNCDVCAMAIGATCNAGICSR